MNLTDLEKEFRAEFCATQTFSSDIPGLPRKVVIWKKYDEPEILLAFIKQKATELLNSVGVEKKEHSSMGNTGNTYNQGKIEGFNEALDMLEEAKRKALL